MKWMVVLSFLTHTAVAVNDGKPDTLCTPLMSQEGNAMFQHAVTIEPRFSDYNVQGFLRWALHFDFACEAHLKQFATRYKIDFSKYQKTGQRWDIKNYRLTMHQNNAWFLQPIWIVSNVTRVDGPAHSIKFSFWNSDRSVEYASGEMEFHLFDVKGNREVPISDDDRRAFLMQE